MRRSLLTAALVLTAACKTTGPAPAASVAQAPAAPAAPASESAPIPPGLDPAAIDPSVDPCSDFYQYACGGWLKTTEIPADRARWSRGFDAIEEQNNAVLREILDAAAAGKPPEGTPYAQALGDFYGACMDEPQLEQSLADLQAELARLNVKGPKALAVTLGRLHARRIRAVFTVEPVQDYKDATQVIGQVDQAGLGLPDRDYYLKDDEKTKAVRDAYVQHLNNVFGLLGQPPAQAAASAAAVMEVETRLARASISKVERRQPENLDHRLDRQGLEQQVPQVPWEDYFKATGAPVVRALNVTHPPFFKEVGAMVKDLEPQTWHTYLTWHLTRSAFKALPKRFQDEDFAFNAKALTGAKQDLPRWKKCVKLTDTAMGHALGVPFIARTFGADGKTRTREVVAEIEAAFERNLDTLDWMDAETRARALGKVRKIANKIGYPDRWREYEGLKVDRKSFLTSLFNANAFEQARQLGKIGKPLDRGEWLMTPPTVNAYYEPPRNEIVFPAGILQPPFFNRAATDAVNFGAMGMVVGHETTHGFDDEGRKFDADGNLKLWWSDASNQRFIEKAGCVKQQFDGYTAVDDLKVNGALTLGENVADLGGLKLAHAAMKAWLEKHPSSATYRYTPSQQFFLGYAQSWCSKIRPEAARARVKADSHSPPFLRVNGPLRNLETFREAFNCPAGSPMARPPTEACQVW